MIDRNVQFAEEVARMAGAPPKRARVIALEAVANKYDDLAASNREIADYTEQGSDRLRYQEIAKQEEQQARELRRQAQQIQEQI